MSAAAAYPHGQDVDVFVSYSHDDIKFASDLARHLEAAGVNVWIDAKGLRGSPGWRRPVAEAIAGCKVVVLLCSKSSFASPFVENEVEYHIDVDPPPPRIFVPIHLEPSTTYPPAIHFCLVGRHKVRVEVAGRHIAEWLAEILEELEQHGVVCNASYSPAPLPPVAPAPLVRPMPPRVARRLETGFTFRMFVSSTFGDLEEERDALHTRVFPHLRQLCLSQGARFLAIDPHWGAQSTSDPRTLSVRLEEIDRCRATTAGPNFLVLLGDRLGWSPPPAEIPAEEFEWIRKRVSPAEGRLLDEWYLRDDNAVPPVHVLVASDGADWESIGHGLRELLSRAVEVSPLAHDAKYTASAVEQEIRRGALGVPTAHEDVFCLFRTIVDLPDDASARGYRDFRSNDEPDADAETRLGTLRARLRELSPGNVCEYETTWAGEKPSSRHLDQLCAEVSETLTRAILDRIEAVG